MEEETYVVFTACKHLEFGEMLADKNSINSDGVAKVTWQRKVPYPGDGPQFQLCQFCKLRGRINQADGCLDESKAHCNRYEETTHTVPLDTINLE